MFPRRLQPNNIARIMRRASSTSNHKGDPYVPKTAFQNATSDSGAYPVMGLIVLSITGVITAGLTLGSHTPDARVTKHSRQSAFRGDLEEEMNASSPHPHPEQK